MKNMQSVRRNLLLLMYFSFHLPVYGFVFFGQAFHMTIFEHANLGSILFIYTLVLTIGALLVNHYLSNQVRIADYVVLVSAVLIVIIVILGQTQNPFTYKYGFLVQIIFVILFSLFMFAPKVLNTGIEKLNDIIMKSDEKLTETASNIEEKIEQSKEEKLEKIQEEKEGDME